MIKKDINVFDYANEITKALKSGVLLTTKLNDKVNSMVIGWGHIGVIWSRPVFVAYVRTNRYTKELLDSNPEFTVNVAINNIDKNALMICGTKSGKDLDKIKEANLTLVPGTCISVPGIKEFPLTLECKVIYRQEQDLAFLSEKYQERHYSVDKNDHIAYFGEILSSYIIEE